MNCSKITRQGIQHPQIQCKKLIPTLFCHTKNCSKNPTVAFYIRTQNKSTSIATRNIQQNHHQSPLNHHHQSPAKNSPSFSLPRKGPLFQNLLAPFSDMFCLQNIVKSTFSPWCAAGGHFQDTAAQRPNLSRAGAVPMEIRVKTRGNPAF